MTDIISKSKVQYDVEKHRGILSAQGFYAESNVLEHLLKKIESGAFDVAVDADVKEIEKALAKATPGDLGNFYENRIALTHPNIIGTKTVAEVHDGTYMPLFLNAPTWLRQLLAKLAEKDAEIERLREELIRAEEARGSILISREQWEKDLYLIWGRSDAP